MSDNPASTDQLSTVKRALIELRELRARLDAAERVKSEPIAIVGIGLRFPGAISTADELWQLLVDGGHAISEVPDTRWNKDAFYDSDPDVPGKMSTRHGGFLDAVDRFDPHFFGITPREAFSMDPQQRLLLEVSWEALEHAGLAPRRLAGSATGVFVGLSNIDYYRMVYADQTGIDGYSASGTSGSVAAGRLSYALGLQGPSLVVDTACSSSLTAVHLACHSLRLRECDLALSGGANVILSPEVTIACSKSHMMAPDGLCKTFDARADGYVRSEGCGVVVLKRLSDAVRDHDRIIAVIRGSAVNQDGRSSGLTVPNGPSQEAVIRRAMANAGVEPRDVAYVEAHGTGTSLGDPIEVRALANVFSGDRPTERPLAIGSVKVNLGHLEAAAGIAGLIKVALAFERSAIPGHPELGERNPHLDWSTLPLRVPAAATPWPAEEGPRIAGVSSFGFSGTNVHVVLEEPPRRAMDRTSVERSQHVLAIAARTNASLDASVSRYVQFLPAAGADFGDICFSANTGRVHFPHRLAIVAPSAADAASVLTQAHAGNDHPRVVRGVAGGTDAPPVVFLFTGQGTQYAGMGRALYETASVFRESVNRCAELLQPLMERPLLSLILSKPGDERWVDDTACTQPALFALEYALAELWRSWGIEPVAVMGHSVGELAAACVAGVFTLDDGLKLVAARGRLMQRLADIGGMVAVLGDPDTVRSALAEHGDRLAIAAINGPQQFVISGERDALNRMADDLAVRGLKVRSMATARAFHSALMEPALAELEHVASQIRFARAALPFISTVTGDLAKPEELATAAYWRRQARDTVRFHTSMETSIALGHRVFVEIGPSPTLLGMAGRFIEDVPTTFLPSLREGRDDWEVMLTSLASLYVRGADVDWSAVYSRENYRTVTVPTSPFERERYWVSVRKSATPFDSIEHGAQAHPLLGRRVPSPLKETIFANRIDTGSLPYMADHVIFGSVVFPGAGYCEAAVAAAAQAFGREGEVEGLVIAEPLNIPGDGCHVQTVVTPNGTRSASFQFFSEDSTAGGDVTWRLHATGTLRAGDQNDTTVEPLDAIRRRCDEARDVAAHYDAVDRSGVAPGPAFRGLTDLWRGDGEALGRIRLLDSVTPDGYLLHPALLDSCLQVLLAALRGGSEELTEGAFFLPVGVERLRVQRAAGTAVWAHGRLRPSAGGITETYTGDIRIFDENGLIADVRGLSAKRATQQALGAAIRPLRKDWLYEVDWQPAAGNPALTPASVPIGTWVVCLDSRGPGNSLADRLEQHGARVVRVERSSAYSVSQNGTVHLDPTSTSDWSRLFEFAALDAERPPAGVVWAWDTAMEVPPTPDYDWIAGHLRRSCAGLLHLAQQLAEFRGVSPRLWMITRGATSAGTSALVHGPTWALARAVATEHPDLRCVCIDLDHDAGAAAAAEQDQLWREVTAPDGEDQIAFRPAGRHVARLRRAGAKVVGAAPSSLNGVRPDATYLVTGGLGALGLKVAEALVESGAAHLILMGRRAPDASAAKVIASLEDKGASVVVMCGDVSRSEEVADVLSRAADRCPPVRGVVHAAGVIDDGVLLQQDWTRFERVLAPKAAGAWNLHDLTKSMELDFFVMFSSAASVIGSPGQSNYSTANAFLDVLARFRRSNGLPAVSINWGPWAESGMAAGLPDKGRQRWNRLGIGVMPPKECLPILDRLLRCDAAQIAVLDADWQAFAGEAGQRDGLPLLRELVASLPPPSRMPAAGGSTRPVLIERLAQAPAGRRRELIASHVREQVKHVLALNASFVLEPHQGLRDLGMDSLTALELRNRLQRSVGSPLPATLTFDHPTVAALSDYLGSHVALDLKEGDAEAAAVPAVESLSDTPQAAFYRNEPIAIVGLGCRLPGGISDPDGFWQLLAEGRDAISDVPADRWDVDAYFDANPDAPGKMYTRRGGFLDAVDMFDPQFFGISRRESVSLDPQQRLLLEVVWEALEHGGQQPDALMGTRTGVFVGISSYDYALLQVKRPDPAAFDAYFATGTSLSVAAGRIAYSLGLQGPCLSVDTACSSSLVAVHLACRSLRANDCAVALAGGVNLMLTPEMTVNGCRAHMLAPDGRCKTFDADADGYARSEGAAVLVLKRLNDALKDNDRVLAVIRGSSINQDGRSSGLTVPNGPAQQTVIRDALIDAGVDPHQVDYVEAHGTGTSLGDPIEVAAIRSVFSESRTIDRPLVVGSVKTNIGHVEAAAGAASLIKTVLMLQHEEIPPHLHFRTLNPHIALDGFPMAIPTERLPWRAGERRRIAGVSSFGFSGTNAHVIVEEAPRSEAQQSAVDRPLHVLALSAKREEALRTLAARYVTHFDRNPGADMADVAFTANSGRAQFHSRLAVTAASVEDAREALAAYAAGGIHPVLTAGNASGDAAPQIAFLLTGQGSQYAGMGRQLFETQPVFRDVLKRCDQILRPWMDVPLLSVLYPGDDAPPGRIDRTIYTQPALFSLEYALAELWRSWGVQPAALLGHSVGEYVAACISGVFTLEDGLKLIAARARLMDALAPGGMAAVFAEHATVVSVLQAYEPRLSVAAINGKTHTVISGENEALSDALQRFEHRGIKTERLKVTRAFHSALTDPMLAEFDRVAQEVTYGQPRIPIASNVTGCLAGREIESADYWRRQVREPVRFSEGLAALRQLGCTHFVEIGPRPVLLGMARREESDTNTIWLPSLRQGRDDWAEALASLSALYTSGVAIDWSGFDRPYTRRKVALPTYPFQRERFWLDERRVKTAATSRLNDLSYAVEWQDKPHQPVPEEQWRSRTAISGTVLILCDGAGIGRALAQLIEREGGQCVLVDRSSEAELPRITSELARAEVPLGCVVHLWSVDDGDVEAGTTVDSLARELESGPLAALGIVQALMRDGSRPAARLFIVTRGAAVAGGPVALSSTPLWGLGRVIALEKPEHWGGSIDLDPASRPSADDAARLYHELFSADGEDQVAFRNGRRSVARFVRAPLATRAVRCRPDRTYLVTGGLGAIGVEIARWLADRGAKHLVLTGRTPLPPRESWAVIPDETESGRRVQAIQALEARGVRVRCVQVDVSDRDGMSMLFDELRNSVPVGGVIHAAGVVKFEALESITAESVRDVCRPKVAGAWVLHQMTRSLNLDFFVMFSSASSVWGGVRQAHYAAANQFLDALGHYRRRLGLPALSINWGPWGELGLASAESTQWLAQFGVSPLSATESLRALEHVMGSNVAQLTIADVDWRRFTAVYTAKGHRRLLDALETLEPEHDPPPAGSGRARESELAQQLTAAAPSERRDVVIAYVQREAAAVLGLPDSRGLALRQGFSEMGMDSLMAVELRDRLQRGTGAQLPPTLAFDAPSVEAIADYLMASVLHEALVTSTVPDATGVDADVADVAALSDEQVKALIAGELETLASEGL